MVLSMTEVYLDKIIHFIYVNNIEYIKKGKVIFSWSSFIPEPYNYIIFFRIFNHINIVHYEETLHS